MFVHASTEEDGAANGLAGIQSRLTKLCHCVRADQHRGRVCKPTGVRSYRHSVLTDHVLTHFVCAVKHRGAAEERAANGLASGAAGVQ